MELTTEQIAYIRQDVQNKGITMKDLVDSLADHICCTIENGPDIDFNKAYNRALSAFGSEGLEKIQQETIFLINLKKEETMKKAMYILGYIVAFLATTGLLFKIQHWPGASVMLTLGIAFFNFGFLPIFFYDKFKRMAN